MITVLVSEPGPLLFRIMQIPPTLDKLQELVGGYIEPICRPDFSIYLNRHGKALGLPRNTLSTEHADALLPGFKRQGYLVGSVVWLGPDGGETSVTPMLVHEISQTMLTLRRPDASVTVVRYDTEVHVYDGGFTAITARIDDFFALAAGNGFGILEVYTGLDQQGDVVSRVEAYADEPVTIHDHR